MLRTVRKLGISWKDTKMVIWAIEIISKQIRINSQFNSAFY